MRYRGRRFKPYSPLGRVTGVIRHGFGSVLRIGFSKSGEREWIMLDIVSKRCGWTGILVLIVGLGLVVGCASRPRSPLAKEDQRAFVIERDLAGQTVGRGTFTAINGTERPFTANMTGNWDGNVLILVEDFIYDDGERDRKTWRLTKLANGEYEGTREDVVGVARGFNEGDSFRLEYKMRLPGRDGGKGRIVGFRDILVLDRNGVITNKAIVGYRGLRVGGVSLTIRRVE